MARLIRAFQRPYSLSSSSSSAKALFNALQQRQPQPQQQQRPFLRSQGTNSPFLLLTRTTHTSEIPKSPFESNILRILRTEIRYQSEYAPPSQPVTKFNSFTVQDWPGERWIRLTRKFGENEDVKIEVTMFDGCVLVPKSGEDSDGDDMHLHLSLLVDICKSDDSDVLEFVCSAWPDFLEIQKVYVLGRDRLLPAPYLGRDFKNLDEKLRSRLHEFLQERGVNDELSVFLHDYMMNKDRIELIHWLGSVKSFVEK
ncbi:uncharacterized protein At2g39795, mitochondrial-like [Malania oleifera]|uniref:uncharacterized protein At2g39795, mitochondrial-like n=1 Tax=Malania oleifera TaxID=397392 RepID=UPI0025AE905A|nr:uncharacterized protein At2g39795, mitochondrial-like [Malania oleifera]